MISPEAMEVHEGSRYSSEVSCLSYFVGPHFFVSIIQEMELLMKTLKCDGNLRKPP